MTSDAAYEEAYVWIWLPGRTEPVVAGLLSRAGKQLVFNYGRSYLARNDKIALYLPELPLEQGVLPLLPGLDMPSCIRDASPDAWGRRVIINRKLGLKGQGAEAAELDELTYLLESGSDRVGALDFQSSPTAYVPRQRRSASLGELLQSADRVESGVPLHPDLDHALQHGTSLGGARPKALIDSDDQHYIAKFSASRDLYNVVKAEYIAMRLGALVGLSIAPVRLVQALGKDVLLVERFDRVRGEGGWSRRSMVSALTIFEMDEMMAPYASYEVLAEVIRHRFANPASDLRELFARLSFNILCGNTDDHARNHAAFWDGKSLTLTPAYDVCPQSRTGNEASQAMLISGTNRMSRLSSCLEAAPHFLLDPYEAKEIIAGQIRTMRERWDQVCGEADLAETDRLLLWGRQFFNPFAFEGAPEDLANTL
jgi:serine/threonine-protein kinase HipA